MIHKLIVGFPRCGTQSHFATYGTSSLEDLIYDPDGIQYFEKTFPNYEPIILIRESKKEHAFSNWTRMCKMDGETRPFKDCQKEYLKKANFEKFMKPWIESYPNIQILKLENLIKDPKFLHVDNFSIPHNTKNNTFILKT
jgi:hypothetical protein